VEAGEVGRRELAEGQADLGDTSTAGCWPLAIMRFQVSGHLFEETRGGVRRQATMIPRCCLHRLAITSSSSASTVQQRRCRPPVSP